MKRYYAHYEKWEDFQNGMYDISQPNKDELINEAKRLRNNPLAFYRICLQVLKHWKVAAKVNLTNTGNNRQSWIGQSACCFLSKVPEILTRKAWGELSEADRHNANLIADRIIQIYEAKNKGVFKNMENKRLSRWHTGRSARAAGAIEQSTLL